MNSNYMNRPKRLENPLERKPSELGVHEIPNYNEFNIGLSLEFPIEALVIHQNSKAEMGQTEKGKKKLVHGIFMYNKFPLPKRNQSNKHSKTQKPKESAK